MTAAAPGVDHGRVHLLNAGDARSGPVLYWMSRDQRARDNWALLFAGELAARGRVPLAVCFCLTPGFLGATIRQYGFMLEGLAAVEHELAVLNIPFILVEGDPGERVAALAEEHRAGTVVCDFDPLITKRLWKEGFAHAVDIPLYEVDAHNIVPCRLASAKQEYAARTFRPKIHALLPAFLTEFPPLREQKAAWGEPARLDWWKVREALRVDRSVGEVSWLAPGPEAALDVLVRFIETGLDRYAHGANDPNSGVRSNLSPYLHFGSLSAQRAAMEVSRAIASDDSREAFMEQLVVRRELSDNYCFHNSGHTTQEGFPAWARTSLEEHLPDRREYIYGPEQLERAETHDELWNAAQTEMALTGKMHGYMRMYWAKKILEWSRSPAEALSTAIYLNDRYELDGRDPNGYTGIAWSIGGVHDRAWSERAVFGKVRYMSYRGCRRKFDVDAYVEAMSRLAETGPVPHASG